MRTANGKARDHDCVDCGKTAYDWSRDHDKDGEDPGDYDPRCRSCHLKYDYTDERRDKISASNKGRATNKSFAGRKHSPETKAKMAEARRRYWAAKKAPD